MKKIDKILAKVASENKIDERIVRQMFMSECRSIEDAMKDGKEVLLRYFGKFWHKRGVKYRMKQGETYQNIYQDYANRGKTYTTGLEEPVMEK